LLYQGNDVSISPGPVARLAELATSLSGRRATVCLEHNEKYEKFFFFSLKILIPFVFI
jgi:hypothetical protein